MSIFKKSVKLQDPYVLQFSKGDSRRLAGDQEVSKILGNLGEQERTVKNSPLKMLPLMTFAVACQLFQQLRMVVVEKSQPLVFETIDILQRQDSGKYVPYIHVTDFKLDQSYRDFSGAIVESIFRSSDFSDIEYESKRDWSNDLLQAYQNANPSQKIIAIVPSEDEAEAIDFRIKYSGLDEVVTSTPSKKNVILPESSNRTEPAPNVPLAHASHENKLESKSIESKSDRGTPTSTGSNNNKDKVKKYATKKTTPSKPQTPKEPSKRRNLSSNVGRVVIPKFEVKGLKAVPEHDKHYVEFQVDQKKAHTNEYLKSLEKRLNADSMKNLTDFQLKQWQAIDKAIRDFKSKNDPSKGLQQEIKQTIAAQKSASEKKTLADLKAKCDGDVEQIQNDADRAIEERKKEYAHQIDEAKEKLTSQYTKKANELFDRSLKERTAAFNTKLKEYQASLDRDARTEFNAHVVEVIANSQNIGGTVFQNLAKVIDDQYTVSITKSHLNAVEVQASADRASLNLKDVKALEREVSRLSAERDALVQSKSELQRLTDSQTAELNRLKSVKTSVDSAASSNGLEKLLALQIAQNQKATSTNVNKDKEENSPEVSHTNRLAVGLATALAAIVFGGGGLWAFQNNQQMSAALSDSKSQISKTQQAASSLDKKYYELNTTNQDLKGKVSSQQSQLSKASDESKAAKSQAQEAQNKLSSSQSTATSSATKTSQK